MRGFRQNRQDTHSLCWASGPLLGRALPDTRVPHVLGSGRCLLHSLFSLHLCPAPASFHIRLSVCRILSPSPRSTHLPTSLFTASRPSCHSSFNYHNPEQENILLFGVFIKSSFMPPVFHFELDECHTIFSHQKAKAEQSGQDGPKVISPTGRCSLRRWGVFSWATGMLPESESPESQYSRGNISREALGLGPVLSWEPVANGDRLRHRGKAWEGPLHPGAQARDLHHHHKSQGEESGIQKRNESLQPPISEPGPKRPRDLLSE